MVTFPPCKINLGLRVLARRPDGYHTIETCFYPLPWTDLLEVVRADGFAFTTSGIPVGRPDDNLCVKAYRLLQQDLDLGPVHIHLHKIIPAGAGLGGGSADAAHTLLLLNDIFSLALPQDRLVHYAAQLGSDCAFFIHNQPMIGTGRGEVLQPATGLSLKDLYMVVVKPPVEVSTAAAYAGVTPGRPAAGITDVLKKPLTQWRDELVNDFEVSVFGQYPGLRQIKERLYTLGAVYASMSGSGSAVYGLFPGEVTLATEFAGCTVWRDKLVN